MISVLPMSGTSYASSILQLQLLRSKRTRPHQFDERTPDMPARCSPNFSPATLKGLLSCNTSTPSCCG
jgi:hypothetical protein